MLGLSILFLTPLTCGLIGAVLGLLIGLSEVITAWNDTELVHVWLMLVFFVYAIVICIIGIVAGAIAGVFLGFPLGLILNIIRDPQHRLYWVAGLGIFIVTTGGCGFYYYAQFEHKVVLDAAIFQDDLPALKEQLRSGDDLGRLLIVAAGADKPEFVRYLIEQGADVNYVDSYQDRTALHFAAEDAHLEVMKILLEQEGADLDRPDERGKTARYLLEKRHGRKKGVAEFLETLDAEGSNDVAE